MWEDLLRAVLDGLALAIELVGGVVVLISLVVGLRPYVSSLLRRQPPPAWGEVRALLGRGLVLSLEIFIAADLLRTILNRSLQEVAVLGAIVFLRTVLSLSLDYEMRQEKEGHGQ